MNRFKIKRSHTELHPAIFVTKNGKIRNAIISHLGECGGECDIDSYFSFLENLKDELELSYVPRYWHKRFKKYVSEHNKDGVTVIKLTSLGNNFFNIVING